MEMTIEVDDSVQDIVTGLIGRYIFRENEIFPEKAVNETAQAHKRRIAFAEGLRVGFAVALEVAIAERRASRYGAVLKTITSPMAYEIDIELLHAVDEAWRTTTSSTDRWEKFIEKVTPTILEYIFPMELEDKFLNERRKAVLAGTIEPDEDDKEWLIEHAAWLEVQAAELRSRFDLPN